MDSDTLPRRLTFCLQWLQRNSGYVFKQPELFGLAFTQKSSRDAQTPSANNERLEFLGDAALSLLIGEALYQEYPEADEGFMTIERSKIVCGQNLSAWGYEAGFDRLICAGDGVKVSEAMVEDAVEAVAGAFFLDGGLDAVRRFLQCFRDYPDQGNGFDARRHLERDCDYEKRGAPNYETTRHRENNRISYSSTITLNGQTIGTGSGSDIEAAEREAARTAMLHLNRLTAEEDRKRSAAVRSRYRKILALRRRKDPPAPVQKASALKQKNEVPLLSAAKAAPLLSVTPAGKPEEKKPNAPEKAQNASVPVTMKEASAPTVKVEEKKAVAQESVRTALDEFLAHYFGKLGVDEEKYAPVLKDFLPPKKSYVLLRLNGNTITTEKAGALKESKPDLSWKVFLLASAQALGLSDKLNADTVSLADRLEKALAEVAGETGKGELSWKPVTMQGMDAFVGLRLHTGQKSASEAFGVDEERARETALIRAVSKMKLWKQILLRLGLAPDGAPDDVTPAQLLETLCGERMSVLPELLTYQDGGNKHPLCRVGLFIGNELCAELTALTRSEAFQWLSLQVLARLVRTKSAFPVQKQPAAGTVAAAPKKEKNDAPDEAIEKEHARAKKFHPNENRKRAHSGSAPAQKQALRSASQAKPQKEKLPDEPAGTVPVKAGTVHEKTVSVPVKPTPVQPAGNEKAEAKSPAAPQGRKSTKKSIGKRFADLFHRN